VPCLFLYQSMGIYFLTLSLFFFCGLSVSNNNNDTYIGTFHQKAEIASKYPGVEYVIVYDSEKGQPLVPMASEFTTDISLLFVSYETGNGKCCRTCFVCMYIHTYILIAAEQTHINCIFSSPLGTNF
jgi:hypothetical protein